MVPCPFLGEPTRAAQGPSCVDQLWGSVPFLLRPGHSSRQNKMMWYLLNPWIVSAHKAVLTRPGQSLLVASQAPATPNQAGSTRVQAPWSRLSIVSTGVWATCAQAAWPLSWSLHITLRTRDARRGGWCSHAQSWGVVLLSAHCSAAHGTGRPGHQHVHQPMLSTLQVRIQGAMINSNQESYSQLLSLRAPGHPLGGPCNTYHSPV